MRALAALLVALTAALAPLAAPAAHAQAGRRLIWSDEFSGESVDYRCWRPEIWRPGNNHDELQRFTSSARNLAVRDGALVISAHQEATGAGRERRAYTSAQLTTVDNAYFTYGYYEARIKAPRGAGAFPAFWMMPQLNEFGWWPNSGEIDIWEYLGRDEHTAYAALHYKGDDWKGGTRVLARPLWEDYHVYALEWLPERMRWFVDGDLIWEKTNWLSPKPKARPRAPFDSPFYLILNLSVGGQWPRAPTPETPWPLELSVDYVRVYAIDGLAPARVARTRHKHSACPERGPGADAIIAASPPPLGRERPAGGLVRP